MNSNVEAASGTLDTVKLAVSLTLLLVALGAFYYYAEVPKLGRVLGLLGALGVSAGIALTTDKGRQLLAFVNDSHIEVRKVVWPTRQETVQTTLAVMVVVVVSAVILWLLDIVLGVAVRFLMGQGG
jgi:preprotein translocase subunit SecE